jgi:ADP-heptose:LPS heptosyltransferase
MNVVAVVDGGLVEALQALPLIAWLRASGHGPLTLATSRAAAAGLEGYLPDVDEVVVLASAGGPARGIATDIVALRRRRLDAAAVCSAQSRHRLLAYAAGCARRVGLTGGPLSLLLTAHVEPMLGENRAAAWLRLAEPLGGVAPRPHPLVDPGDLARRRAETLLVGRGFEDGRPLVALVAAQHGDTPPSGALSWEPERFAHLANQLAERHGAGVVLLGAIADRPAVDRLLLDLEASVLDLCGELSLMEAAAVTERCDLVIAGDSPLLHLAATLGTPTVGLYGPTDGRMRGPLGVEHRVIQGVSEADASLAMNRIRVDDVLATVEAREIGVPV